ncbi:MAG: AAA family ATPase [Lachnospiraceae bacterium]|nr:AAA family ATPase [Lachnospiraceae bacterium]
MNIRQAKEYIKNSVNIYLKKDEFGEYCIPVVRQRPIFLLGAPGIGKTAIMEQIAQEMGIALVSYSMTHHTRQSALGLPFIAHRTYNGQEYDISEYTMSEIIAAIHETMEESGIREGILFLDEINCVSETLAPAMLQFLQYKIFGRHSVPEGWVIVTAGNPPEYNKSVREFDVVTMDRLKVMEVEADYRTWKEYALECHLHSAVLNFLDLKKEYFYHMEITAKGRSYVTARGWEDLSQILYHYEEESLGVDENLVGQYIRNEKIVREFTAYYDLYRKYRKDYRIQEILEGRPSVQAISRAKEAPFDERLSLVGMLLDRMLADMQEVMEQAAVLTDIRALLLAVKNTISEDTRPEQTTAYMERLEEQKRGQMFARDRAGNLSPQERRKCKLVLQFLEQARRAVTARSDGDIAPQEAESGVSYRGEKVFEPVRDRYETAVSAMKRETERVQGELHHLFVFAQEAFAEGNEMLILVTELTVSSAGAGFIAAFGSPDYQRHSQDLMLSERQSQIQGQIAELEL